MKKHQSIFLKNVLLFMMSACFMMANSGEAVLEKIKTVAEIAVEKKKLAENKIEEAKQMANQAVDEANVMKEKAIDTAASALEGPIKAATEAVKAAELKKKDIDDKLGTAKSSLEDQKVQLERMDGSNPAKKNLETAIKTGEDAIAKLDEMDKAADQALQSAKKALDALPKPKVNETKS